MNIVEHAKTGERLLEQDEAYRRQDRRCNLCDEALDAISRAFETASPEMRAEKIKQTAKGFVRTGLCGLQCGKYNGK